MIRRATLLLLAAGFLAGVFHLFELRFQSGEVFAPYSSLRADPLGTKALFEAYAALPGLRVERNLRPLSSLAVDASTTLYFAGLPKRSFGSTCGPADPDESLEALALRGGRVIAALAPVSDSPLSEEPSKASPTPSPTPEKECEPDCKSTFEFKVSSQKSAGPAISADGAISIPWRSLAHFSEPVAPWKVLLRCNGMPVAIERQYGKGSLVLLTDSYFLSNEAMRAHPNTKWLSALHGGGTTVVFDETHLGTAEGSGIAILARKYRLHGLVAGLLVIAALYLWRCAVPFPPPARQTPVPGSEIRSGKDSTSGLINLLRRNIAPGELIQACLQQWKRSFARQTNPNRLAAAEAAAAANHSRPVEAHQSITAILTERK